MLGNGFHEAALGRAELGRRLEQARQRRLWASCELAGRDRMAQVGSWMGRRLIAVGEALCARSSRKQGGAWLPAKPAEVLRLHAR